MIDGPRRPRSPACRRGSRTGKSRFRFDAPHPRLARFAHTLSRVASIARCTNRCRRAHGWKFTTGSVLTLLIGSQLLTGSRLDAYCVPAPSLAYDSVRFIMRRPAVSDRWCADCTSGAPAFFVVAAAVHMLRVFLTGSFKAPRELTWITRRSVLLLLILGFSLSGYLLPWDQKAYWATTVTINVARRARHWPVTLVADIMRGGPDLGALDAAAGGFPRTCSCCRPRWSRSSSRTSA